ncbi:hypothetical protein OUZ56_006280 [Daphnia magna]|uniref:Uncharacterized protein n=1 Tax=Daphnia magna TaxID=35525 RepID=A0ABQ9YV91_9CRUS|nr:hypothetical protein OUZ56_006280 [Daphnia magna]
MRLIFFMTLAGTLALDSLNANERLDFGSPKTVDNSKAATFVIDGKFTVQLLVSIKPTEEEIVRRRTVFANRRRPNRKEMSATFKEEFSLQLADGGAIIRTKEANKNRSANEGQVKRTTTARPKNRFGNRLSTTTARYPLSKNSAEEDDLRWDSRKTQNVKGSIKPALKKTVPTSSRPRINRIRTTTLRSPVSTDSWKTHFALVEQAFDNGRNKSRALQIQKPAAIANDTVPVFHEQPKEVDVINLKIAANHEVKANETQSDDAHNSDLIHSKQDGHLKEEQQVEAPIFRQAIVGHEFAVEQQPTAEIMPTKTVDVKLPLPLNRRKPTTPESGGQEFHVKGTLTAQVAQNSTATAEPVSRHLKNGKLLDGGYDNEQGKSKTNEENKQGDSFGKNEETGTKPTMETDNAPSVNASNCSVIAFSFNEGQLEEIAKFDEPIFRHSVADRDFSSEITTPVGDLTTSVMEVSHLQPNNLAVNSPTLLDNIPAVNEPDVSDEITTTEAVMDVLPITEIQPTKATSKDEDPNAWKKIGDIEIQMNPQTKEVVNIKSQTTSGVHFIMATSHIRISLHPEESRELPWDPIGDFQVQMDPQTKQVVNIRTQTITTKRPETRTYHPIYTRFEQHGFSSTEQPSVHQPPNLNADDGQSQSTAEVLVNKTETVATVPLQTTTNPSRLIPSQEPEKDSTELGYEMRMNQESDKEVRMQITTSTPDQSSVREESADIPAIGGTHADTIAVKLPTTIDRRRPNDSDKEISIEVDDDVTTRKKQVDRVRAIGIRRPSSRNSEGRGVFLLRPVDEEDDVPLEPKLMRVNPINFKKKKVVIVNEDDDERRIDGQRGDTRKESPYFYYHYDSSHALASSSCNLPLSVGSVLFLFFVL